MSQSESKTISDRERTCSWHIYNIERNAADWVEQAHRDFNAGWDARHDELHQAWLRVADLENENKRLREALEYYAVNNAGLDYNQEVARLALKDTDGK